MSANYVNRATICAMPVGGGSIQLMRIFGIRVGVTASWFAVAAAGPLVTLIVAVGCAAAATLVDSSTHFLDAARLQADTNASPAYVLLSFVSAMNVVLFIFNLAPGFPLDGGRIVFAGAWKVTGDRNKGMRIAGRGGVAFAYLLGGLGLYLLLTGAVGDGIWFVAIAWLLLPAARAAIVQGTMRARLLSVTVAEVMDPNPVVIEGSLRLIEAKEQIFDPQDWPFVGVTDEDNHFLGVLTRERLEDEIAAGRPALEVGDVLGADRMDWLIRTDQQLEDLLSHPTLATPGAVFAVDREDFLRGVVTAELLRRAITPAPGR